MKNRTSLFAYGALVTKKNLNQPAIRELIAKGTLLALDEAWWRIESESDCTHQLEEHYAYKDYMRAFRALRGSSGFSSVV